MAAVLPLRPVPTGVLVHARQMGMLGVFARPAGTLAPADTGWERHRHLKNAWKYSSRLVLYDVGSELWVLQRRRDRVDPKLVTWAAESFVGSPLTPRATFVMPMVLRVPMIGPAAFRGSTPPPGKRCHPMLRLPGHVLGLDIETRLVAHTEHGTSWFVDVHLVPHEHPNGAARKAIFTADARHLICCKQTTDGAALIGQVLDGLALVLGDLEAEGFAPEPRTLKLHGVAEGIWFPGVGDIAWDVSLPTVDKPFEFIAVPAPTAVRRYSGPAARSLELQRLASSPAEWRT